jgi:hypothetical protein
VFVQLIDPTAAKVAGELSRSGRIVRARLPLDKLPQLTSDENVSFVEVGESIKPPRPSITAGKASAPLPSTRKFGKEADHHFGDSGEISIPNRYTTGALQHFFRHRPIGFLQGDAKQGVTGAHGVGGLAGGRRRGDRARRGRQRVAGNDVPADYAGI